MGIYEKLKLAWVCGYRQVDLHIESQVVVSNLVAKRGGATPGWRLVQNTMELLSYDWVVIIRHS
jgi:hypothetical protein